MKYFYFVLILNFFVISCATAKRYQKPDWTNDIIKVEKDYVTVVGISEDFGSKSWQMAEIDAHRKLSKLFDVYVEAYRQTYKKIISSPENKEGYKRIITKKHITSQAYLKNLEIVKDKNNRELRWYDEENKKYYVKIRLNLNAVSKKLNDEFTKDFTPQDREKAIRSLKERSKEAHKRLNEKLKNMKWDEY